MAYRSPPAVCKAPSRGVFLFCSWVWKNLVPVPSTDQIREALMFSQFRFKLIEFLKLPLDIGEIALREVLERISCGVCRNYLARAERIDAILKSEDVFEMSAPVFRWLWYPALIHARERAPKPQGPFLKEIATMHAEAANTRFTTSSDH
jgi:hypothetical protein